MELKVNKNGTEVGFAVQECVHRIMKAQGFDHPIEGVQYLIEHLCAIAATLSIPPIHIIESVMQAIEAGTRASGQVEELFQEFQQEKQQKAH